MKRGDAISLAMSLALRAETLEWGRIREDFSEIWIIQPRRS
jgi:hypothetical protein